MRGGAIDFTFFFGTPHAEFGRGKPSSYGCNGEDAIAVGTSCDDGGY
jgi:hypothetical protein